MAIKRSKKKARKGGRFARRSAPRRRPAAKAKPAPRRKKKAKFGHKLTWPWKLACAAFGVAAAELVPYINKPVYSGVPLTWAFFVGAAAVYKGKTDLLRYAGLGMMLGGGAMPYARQLVAKAVLMLPKPAAG